MVLLVECGAIDVVACARVTAELYALARYANDLHSKCCVLLPANGAGSGKVEALWLVELDGDVERAIIRHHRGVGIEASGGRAQHEDSVGKARELSFYAECAFALCLCRAGISQ